MKALLAPIIALLLLSGDSTAWAQTAVQEDSSQTGAQTEAVLSPLQQAIAARLGALPGARGEEGERRKRIKAWYDTSDFKPLWISDGKVNRKAQEVVFKLMTAYEDGLLIREYGAEKLFGRISATGVKELAGFEIDLTRSAVLFGQHLNAGRVNPNQVNRDLVVFPDAINADRLLTRLDEAKKPAAELALLKPKTPRYDRLRKHLLALKVAEAQGGWSTVPKGDVLKDGMEDPRVPVLRQRLIESRDLPKNAHSGNAYDGALVQAVKRFQWRNGLLIDGVVGPGTLEQLNVPVETRIEQVVLNLERRRWMQNDYGDPHVFVNLADQVLKLVKGGETVFAELVQVGKPFHATPVFSDQMSYLDFNPYWNVPYSIATKEYLPKLKRNPYALQRQNIRVLRNGSVVDPGSVPWSAYSRGNFPVRLRQDPGPKNALGRVKFMFPNKFNIYIHDTPSKSNFNRASRYFSHGCIRLKNPFQFAEKVLALQGMGRGDIERIAASGKKTAVKLDNKIKVHITYLTAWVNKDGSVHYRRDIYGRDAVLEKALSFGT